jgi:Fe-S-cluster-containing dehydrogenase component/CRP-like cAMP-binding protein
VSAAYTTIPRPQRWQTPYGVMSDGDIAHVMALEPFASMDPARFVPPITLEGVVRHDMRLVRYQDGDIVVRAGDYGNSAFLILSGRLRVVLPPGLPSELLGRAPDEAKSAWSAISQLWRNPKLPEVRDPERYTDARKRHLGEDARAGMFLQDLPRVLDRCETNTMEAGELFGEIAALGRTQRLVTVLADGPAEVLEMRWQGLRDIRMRDEAFRRHVESLYRRHSLQAHLRETDLFRHLPAEVLDAIAEETLFETYGHFDWHASYKRSASDPPEVRLEREPVVVAEGDYPDGLLLIRSGFGRVTKRFNHGERTLRYLGRGGIFGLTEILDNWERGGSAPHDKTLRAVGYTDVLRVPTAVVERHVLAGLPAADLERVRRALSARPSAEGIHSPPGPATASQESRRVQSEALEMLVDYRFINGTAAMVIDMDRCVRCDACVEACAATHGNNPRFVRHGQRYGPIMVANACMHCADPVCMIGCPTGAIHRSDRGGEVLINDDTCIGCATCANSCPYDNIRMVEVRDPAGRFIYDESTRQPIRKATKCDLCHDQPGGPACQRACPHDALGRLDLRDLTQFAEWVNR